MTFTERERSDETQHVPDAERGGVREDPDAVTWLQLCDTDALHALPRLRRGGRHYTLGSASDQDIVISSPYVSAQHCRLVRTSLGLKVVDRGSRNGTYFEGRRKSSFYLDPGQAFTVGARAHRVLALDDEMRAHYPALTAILGYEDEHAVAGEPPSPSNLIAAAVAGSHVLITGEPHCDQDRLARIVHAVSLFRGRPLVAIDRAPDAPGSPDVDAALHRAATVVLDLGDHRDRLDPALASRLFSPRYQTRLIALARSVRVATAALGERCVMQMAHVRLEPLSRRRGAIHRLLDAMFQERGSSLRVSALAPYNQDALRRHRWARNFVSLREAADRLVVIAREPTLRRAALTLGIPPSSFHHWYSNIVRLELPLLATVTAVAGQEAVS